MAPREGLEPSTLRLTAACSTIELPRNKNIESKWCAQRDLNPHGRPLDPKSSASANSAMRA